MAMDNKHNLAQREQFYAAVQKGMGPERIPEYAEDISPYATFHVAGHVGGHVGSHLYHEQRLAAMETLQLKSVSASAARNPYTTLYPQALPCVASSRWSLCVGRATPRTTWAR